MIYKATMIKRMGKNVTITQKTPFEGGHAPVSWIMAHNYKPSIDKIIFSEIPEMVEMQLPVIKITENTQIQLPTKILGIKIPKITIPRITTPEINQKVITNAIKISNREIITGETGISNRKITNKMSKFNLIYIIPIIIIILIINKIRK